MRLEIIDDNDARKTGVARYSQSLRGCWSGERAIDPSVSDGSSGPGRPSAAARSWRYFGEI